MSTLMRETGLLGRNTLSVVVIGPQWKAIAKTLAGLQATIARQFDGYPDVDDLMPVLESDCDVAIVDLSGDPERALDLIENMCAGESGVTVMAYSDKTDADLLVRCMRAGAREFLNEPVQPETMAEALVRASARRQEVLRQKRPAGVVSLFVGAKGGSGVTTVASNFAVALAAENVGPVVLLDLDLQLGDAALTLGLTTPFSTVDALRSENRLDAEFLGTLIVKHSSGLSVLAAPDSYSSYTPSPAGLQKLLRILRDEYAHVVVDAGSGVGSREEALFEASDKIYLITQVGIPELRNSHRLISHLGTLDVGSRVEVVLNRFDARLLDIDEGRITKALTQQPAWRIPSDYQAVRRAQNSGSPITAENGTVSRVIMQMARAACGKTANPEKKKRFGLFG
jgi:pilus assembly protein CpaE